MGQPASLILIPANGLRSSLNSNLSNHLASHLAKAPSRLIQHRGRDRCLRCRLKTPISPELGSSILSLSNRNLLSGMGLSSNLTSSGMKVSMSWSTRPSSRTSRWLISLTHPGISGLDPGARSPQEATSKCRRDPRRSRRSRPSRPCLSAASLFEL